MKLGLTSLDILAIVKELNSTLISARIENVYEVAPSLLLLKVHAPSGTLDLLVDPQRRISLTRFKHSAPERPTPTAMALRRFLAPSKIIRIDQVDFDRIVALEVEKGGEKYRAYLEIFGDGNIIVADEGGTIKFALHQREMKDRVLKAGACYVPPPKRGVDVLEPFPPDALRGSYPALKSLTRVFNLPSELVEEGLARAGIAADLPSGSLTDQDVAAFRSAVLSILEDVRSGSLKPAVIRRGGERVTVVPVDFVSIEGEREWYPTFNEAVDVYFSGLAVDQAGEKKRAIVEEKIKGLEAIRARQLGYIEELERKRADALEKGKILMSSLEEVQSLISKVLASRRAGKDWGEISSMDDRIRLIDSDRGLIRCLIGGQEVELDFKTSAARNAERYFSESKEAARKLDGLRSALKETEEKIDEARKGLLKVEKPTLLRAMKRDWYEKFRWTYSSDGFLIIGGKDATQNEVLVKKHLEPKDIFAHADLPGGSVVIVKSMGQDIPERTKSEAVAFAVVYSRAWKAGIGVADGYWVFPDQVTKAPPSGEYLGKGAFMIYGERNYVRNIPLKLQLGVLLSGDEYKLVAGVGEFVRSKTPVYVNLAPGGLEGKRLLAAVKEGLADRAPKEDRDKIYAIPDSEILGALPQGGCAVE